VNATDLIRWGWRVAPRMPGFLVRSIAAIIADVTWLIRNQACANYEENLAYVWPKAGRRQIRRVSRSAMRSTMRYYAETMTMSAVSTQQILARVRAFNQQQGKQISLDSSVVIALCHQGNYDLAGAWVAANFAPLVTVAERLEPPELFEDFCRYRQELGMRVYAHTGDNAFRNLVREVRGGHVVVALVSDRDMSGTAVPVTLFGHEVHVAAGPAALAYVADIPILPLSIRYERLTGWRRIAAGWPWGIVLTFHDPVYVDRSLPRKERLQVATQAWVDAIADSLRDDPADWHMMMPYFNREAL
jgi:lauroyl/myristoyl acyltransferase